MTLQEYDAQLECGTHSEMFNEWSTHLGCEHKLMAIGEMKYG